MFEIIFHYRYVPPITSSSPKLPDTIEEIQKELNKQESLLNQIHSEMNAGFVTKKREEQLWEVQRIITQLKRKLKAFEKKQEKSQEEHEASSISLGNDVIDSTVKPINTLNENESKSAAIVLKNENNSAGQVMDSDVKQNQHELKDEVKDDDSMSAIKTSPPFPANFTDSDGLYIDEETGLLMVAKSHPDYSALLRLQLENQELLNWKTLLQARINAERAEFLRLKQLYQQMTNKIAQQKPTANSTQVTAMESQTPEGDYERIVEHLIQENALLEHKKQMLSKEIFEENKQCISYQVELAMQKF